MAGSAVTVLKFACCSSQTGFKITHNRLLHMWRQLCYQGANTDSLLENLLERSQNQYPKKNLRRSLNKERCHPDRDQAVRHSRLKLIGL